MINISSFVSCQLWNNWEPLVFNYWEIDWRMKGIDFHVAIHSFTFSSNKVLSINARALSPSRVTRSAYMQQYWSRIYPHIHFHGNSFKLDKKKTKNNLWVLDSCIMSPLKHEKTIKCWGHPHKVTKSCFSVLWNISSFSKVIAQPWKPLFSK